MIVGCMNHQIVDAPCGGDGLTNVEYEFSHQTDGIESDDGDSAVTVVYDDSDGHQIVFNPLGCSALLETGDPYWVKSAVAVTVGPSVYVRIELSVIVDIHPVIYNFRSDGKLRKADLQIFCMHFCRNQ